MAYGMSLITNGGEVNVADINVARIYTSTTKTGASGSFTVSGFDSTNGHIQANPLDNKAIPNVSWNNSTKTLSWDATGLTDPSSSINFVFIVID